MSNASGSTEAAQRVPVPLGDRLKAVVAGAFGLPILGLGLYFFVGQDWRGSWIGVGVAVVFVLFSAPFNLLAVRLWTGADRQPVPAGYARCGACKRALPEDKLGTMWSFSAALLSLPWAAVAEQEAARRYCRRCALTQSIGALFLAALFLVSAALPLLRLL
jgi:hypothetical protein